MAKLPSGAFEALTYTYNNPLVDDTIDTLPGKLGITASDNPATIKRKVNAVKGETLMTPLHLISGFGDQQYRPKDTPQTSRDEVPDYLFENGANPNALDREGKTPLHWAARKGNEHMFNWLLDNGANVDAKDTRGGTIDQEISSLTDKEMAGRFQKKIDGVRVGMEALEVVGDKTNPDTMGVVRKFLGRGRKSRARRSRKTKRRRTLRRRQ
jgi:hypothetical protein